MATTKCCDRYRTTKGIKPFRITLRPGEGGEPLMDRTFDLSPRGLAWVKNWIERGITKLDEAEAKTK